MKYPKAECPSCDEKFRPFYSEQIYCDKCREEGWAISEESED